jgi:Fe-S cluster assembly iron-binding protein IscA
MISVTQKAADKFNEMLKSEEGSEVKMMRINFEGFG